MADILKSFTSNLIRFAAGERPSADKFNAMVSYFSRGMEDISRAIGDVYDVRPEGTLHSAKWNATNGERRNLDILNLARIIGPASNLNARMLNNSSTGKLVSETILLSTKEHELNYELNDGNTFILTPDNLTKVNSNNFTNENQYYYNRENNSIVFAKKTVEEITLSYFTIPSEYFGGLNYSEASFNVIPDPNVFESDYRNTPDALLKIERHPTEENSYFIDLPKSFAQQSGLANENAFKDVNLLNIEEYNYQSQIELPEWMSSLSNGDVVPLNSLYLKDLTLGEAYLTADYFYVNQTRIEIKNASLCLGEGHNFVLVTVGTDITTSIDDLRLKWFRHTHDGKFGEERINIKNLAGVFVKEHVRLFLPDVTFSKSSVEDNHLPMYLHRIGYTTDTSVNNGNNSMLGTLLMSRLEFDYQDADNQPIQSKDGVSQTLSFGGIGNDGAHIKRDSNSNLYIEGQENPKTGSTIAPNVQINSYNNIDSIAVDSIVNTAPNIFEKANYIYDDYEQNKKIRYENGSQELFTNQEYYYQNRESIDNTLDSNTINDAEHSLDYSSTFETTDLFNTKTDLTIWKDHSDIQIRKDIENTYTLQPRMLSNIPDYYRPNLNKINESSGSFEWLVYAGEVYKNGDESTKIGCPAIGYKNLNIKEYILPIEDDNFVLEYKDEIQLNSDENFDLPWLDNSGNEIQNNVNHEHVISFGEFQSNSGITYLGTQRVLREGFDGDGDGGYDYLDHHLRKLRFISDNKRCRNFTDITRLFMDNEVSLKTSGYAGDTDSFQQGSIQLHTVRDVTDTNDDYRYHKYGEVVIFEKVDNINWTYTDKNQFHDYWKFRNGIFTHGYFSQQNESDDESSSTGNISKYRKYPKALINENFAIYVKNTETNKIYWLKPYFVTYDDFNMNYTPVNSDPRKESVGNNGDPYNTQGDYDYTVLGNTIRFHIRTASIGESNFNSFNSNKDSYQFILVHSFENKENTHQTHDNYIYLNDKDGNATDGSWYTIQQSNNSLYYNEDDQYSLNKKNIVKYTDFKGHLKNAQYSGITNNSYWNHIVSNDYLLNFTSFTNYTNQFSTKSYKGYYPIPSFLYSLPYGKEYIHRVHNDNSNPIKPKVNRWKDYGENSQYITILRKEPDQAGRFDNEVIRRFKIKALNDGEYNKEVVKFNFINFDFESIYEKSDGSGNRLFRTVRSIIESSIEWLNIPNFVVSYTNLNEFKKRSESDFYFSGYYLDIENDNTYLNTNGKLTKPICIKINKQDLGIQYKKDINLSIYLKKYISLNLLNFALLPNQDYLISKSRNFSLEKLIAAFNNFKKTIFSSSYYYKLSMDQNDILNIDDLLYTFSENDIYTDGIKLDLATDILNYVYSLNFIMDVKEIINKDSITLDIDFKITNLEVDKIRVNSDLDHVK